MNVDELMFFINMPQMLSVYKTLRDKLSSKYTNVQVKVSKTQISFKNRHVFAVVTLPLRRMKNAPEVYAIVSFGLPYRLNSFRIFHATEPHPNRWTHHVLIEHDEDVDTQLMEWLDAAFQFSMIK